MENTNGNTPSKTVIEINGKKVEINDWKSVAPFTYQNHNDRVEWGGENRRLRYKSETITDSSTMVMIDNIPVAVATTEYIFQPELSIGHPDCEITPVLWNAPDGQVYLAFQWFKIIKDSKGKIKDVITDGKLEIPGRISKKLLETNGMESDDANAIGEILAKNGCQLILTGNSVYQKKKEEQESSDDTPIQRVRNLLKSRPETSVS